jgi:integrase/recombinase XerD
MPMHNPNNERIKRQYFVFLKEAKRQSEDSVDAVAKALTRFEADTRYRDFRAFHFEQAVAFKKRLAA